MFQQFKTGDFVEGFRFEGQIGTDHLKAIKTVMLPGELHGFFGIINADNMLASNYDAKESSAARSVGDILWDSRPVQLHQDRRRR